MCVHVCLRCGGGWALCRFNPYALIVQVTDTNTMNRCVPICSKPNTFSLLAACSVGKDDVKCRQNSFVALRRVKKNKSSTPWENSIASVALLICTGAETPYKTGCRQNRPSTQTVMQQELWISFNVLFFGRAEGYTHPQVGYMKTEKLGGVWWGKTKNMDWHSRLILHFSHGMMAEGSKSGGFGESVV